MSPSPSRKWYWIPSNFQVNLMICKVRWGLRRGEFTRDRLESYPSQSRHPSETWISPSGSKGRSRVQTSLCSFLRLKEQNFDQLWPNNRASLFCVHSKSKPVYARFTFPSFRSFWITHLVSMVASMNCRTQSSRSKCPRPLRRWLFPAVNLVQTQIAARRRWSRVRVIHSLSRQLLHSERRLRSLCKCD